MIRFIKYYTAVVFIVGAVAGFWLAQTYYGV